MCDSSGHSGRFGHEFLEFDFRVVGDGRSAVARYANNSNYRNDSLIRKESLSLRSLSETLKRELTVDCIVCVSSLLVDEIKTIIKKSEILKYI